MTRRPPGARDPREAPEALCAAYEQRAAEAQGQKARRASGLYYTPPAIAARVVELALLQGPALGPRPRVLDPCAGAGVFLLAAARALPEAAIRGTDLDPAALAVAARALGQLDAAGARPRPVLRPLDALAERLPGPLADLLVANPPYGLAPPEERAALVQRFPALSGEVDRYTAFLLRALELVRPGGCAALLVPDTWMTNARQRTLREAILDRALLRAVADLGKPFASAKDTRVQCVVLEPLPPGARPRASSTWVGRLAGDRLEPLAPIDLAELRSRARAGWQPYRSPAERRLCQALEAESLPLEQVCTVGYGLRTGDNGRFVHRGPRTAANGSSAIPLCGGEDIVPFALRWREKHLVDPTPKLRRLAEQQLGRPRVAIQRIRTNAQAPWMRWLEAAPVPEGLVCLDSLSTLATDDEELRWALLALCGSVAWNRWHRLRTTDVNVKPSALRELPVPRGLVGPRASRPGRARLAALARSRIAELAAERPVAGAAGASPRRAGGAGGPPTAPATERAIDAAVYALFGLSAADREVAERGFWGDSPEPPIDRLRPPD